MKNLFLPYELALALKELGFDEPCLAYWDDDKSFELNPEFLKGSQMDDSWLNTPTFSQAFRWFREKYGLQSIIVPFAENSVDENSNTLYYHIINKKQFYGFVNAQEEIGFNSQEKAELECLKKLIEICRKSK